MKMSKEKRALIAGMIGCLLYVIGDFLFAATGKSQSTESIGLMVKVAYLDMATWRMVVSIICGVLGTLNPYEHGECYVTVDGHEADLDLEIRCLMLVWSSSSIIMRSSIP